MSRCTVFTGAKIGRCSWVVDVEIETDWQVSLLEWIEGADMEVVLLEVCALDTEGFKGSTPAALSHQSSLRSTNSPPDRSWQQPLCWALKRSWCYLAAAPWPNETLFFCSYKCFEPNVSSLWGQMGYMFNKDSGLALLKLSLIKSKDLNWLATGETVKQVRISCNVWQRESDIVLM